MFNNALVDGSFGVTSKIYLAQMTPDGFPLGTIEVPSSQIVTSFPQSRNWRSTSRTAGFAEVLRGVSFTPGTR